MEQTYVEEIGKATAGIELLQDCKWFKPGLGFTCKAIDVGLDSFVECLEKNSHECPFSVSRGYSYYCKCPLRVYIARKLKK